MTTALRGDWGGPATPCPPGATIGPPGPTIAPSGSGVKGFGGPMDGAGGVSTAPGGAGSSSWHLAMDATPIVPRSTVSWTR